MARSKNHVSLIGNLGSDPKVKVFTNGDKVVSFSLATSEDWNDKDTGEPKTATEWHSISVHGAAAEFCEKFLRKGSKIDVEGQLKTRKWVDPQQIERSITEIIVRAPRGTIIPCDGGQSSARQQPASAPVSQQQHSEPPSSNHGFDMDILDHEIPF